MANLTLFVRNLPPTASSERLSNIFSEVGPVKRCFVVKDKESEKCRGIGYVTYSITEDAQRALSEINEYDGQKISVIYAKKKLYDKKQKKDKAAKEEPEAKEAPEDVKDPKQVPKGLRKKKLRARLIIRNLSFQCTEDDLKNVFSKYGTVLDVHIPLKADGKKRGFAFVQFKNMLEAGKALEATNLKEIKDRRVAVDWAVPKDKFVANQPSSGVKKDKENLKAEEDEDEDDEEEAPPKSEKQKEQSEDEDEKEDDSDEEEEEEKDPDSESQDAGSDESASASDDDSDVDDDDDDDDDDDEEPAKKKKKKKLLPSDVNEGRTIFIRNLPYDSEDESLEEVLLQFGELNYVRVVFHPDTGLSKGCAFAQFKSKEATEKCLTAAQEDSEAGGVRLDGRKLNIVLAVTREDAVKLKSKQTKSQKGSRNLYLAREGLIRAGTKAAEGVSDSDMAKRARFEELKRAKLKDINVFVSKTRLCVHNLPQKVDRKQLFKICLTAAGGGKGVRIKECHVMYDRKPVRGQPAGRSLGYGFVEYQEHNHALQALRHLNNNPSIFSSNKRPIVEFSLEDGRKLKLKASRIEKAKAKAESEKKQGQTADDQTGQKKKRKTKPGADAGPTADVQQNLGSHYSGFRTTAEVEHVELSDGRKRQKVLPMPSHRGPKIRNRDKGKQLVQARKVKSAPRRNERNVVQTLEKPSQNKKRKRGTFQKEDDHFERLVEQYKKKLTGTGKSKATPIKKSKWFS